MPGFGRRATGARAARVWRPFQRKVHALNGWQWTSSLKPTLPARTGSPAGARRKVPLQVRSLVRHSAKGCQPLEYLDMTMVAQLVWVVALAGVSLFVTTGHFD